MSVSVGGQCLRDLRDPLKRPKYEDYIQRTSRDMPNPPLTIERD